MAFKAELKLGSDTFKLLSCSYALHRNVGPSGRPQSDVTGGTFSFMIESTTNTFFTEWMLDIHKGKDGDLIFYKHDEDAAAKTLKFKNAYVIDYSETFQADGGAAMYASVVITAEELDVAGTPHSNEWAAG
ncbi:type VI secretion system tube protein TssD [Eudoraea adriatica]|uniref:type VI secretion system tube protein TssD n=1 Tax=Eudoraea adriatica TaxID=446681 RepID=UPI00036BD3F5|nr:type VI secretion system tube protein TssD [Eudoraea adriatica]